MYIIFNIDGGLHMRRTRKKKIGNTIGRVLDIISITMILWVMISFIDVNMHNLSANPEYSNWNIIIILINWMTGA